MLPILKKIGVLTVSLTCLSSGVVAATCKADVASCTILELCSSATVTKRGYLEWNFDALDHVAYAKKNGLTCGVEGLPVSSQNQTSPQVKFTKNEFATYNRLERMQVQYALKMLGYYSSGVDGLWGKGTENGLSKFIRDEGITENLATNVYKSLTLAVDVSDVTLRKPSKSTSGADKSVASASVKSASDQKRKICRLDENLTFENMLNLNSDLTRRTKKGFNGLREIEVSDGKLINGQNSTKANDDGRFKLYIPVLCEKNANNWSRCGTFQARAELQMVGSNILKGDLLIPWEWAARSPTTYRLKYSCKNS
jgi:hypothetical protein